MYDVIILGCGVVGAAAAYQLARYPLRVAVLEAQNDVANGTTKANSAIIHAGYDPEPGTLMAKLNVEGNAMAGDICQKLNVPFARVGSLVLAFDQPDLATLRTLYDRGITNGVPGLELWDAQQVHQREPNLNPRVMGALYAPTAGIVDPWQYALAMAEVAVTNGVELHRSAPVTAISPMEGGYAVTTPKGVFQGRYVFNAAGVFADQVHKLLEPVDYRITPNRGEYYLMDKSQHEQVSHVVFQCPNQTSKGVLVAPTIHGNLIVGPNAQPVEDRLDLGNTAQGLDFVRTQAQRSVPGLNFRENIRNFAGLRANSTRRDFILEESANHPGFFDLAGIKSPGLASAAAIGKWACERILEKEPGLEPREDFVDQRTHVVFHTLSPQEKNALIAQDPRYGRVICRCETVTEGEIVAALHSPIPPYTINGVKRRCNAGMGRCQGGFCGPRVQAILARELGLDPCAVLLDQEGTYVLTGETKIQGGDAHV